MEVQKTKSSLCCYSFISCLGGFTAPYCESAASSTSTAELTLLIVLGTLIPVAAIVLVTVAASEIFVS